MELLLHMQAIISFGFHRNWISPDARDCQMTGEGAEARGQEEGNTEEGNTKFISPCLTPMTERPEIRKIQPTVLRS